MFFKQEELGNKEEKAIVLPETHKISLINARKIPTGFYGLSELSMH